MMEQMSLGIDISEERKAFELVYPEFKNILHDAPIDSGILNFREIGNCSSVSFMDSGEIVFQIRIRKKTNYILIPEKYESMIPFGTNISKSKSNPGMVRISIQSYEDILKYVSVLRSVQENENQVNKPAKSKQAASQQPDDTSSGLANIETVCAEPAKEQAQKESDPPILMNVAKTAIVINIVVNNVDNRLLILGLYRICACVGSTIGAELDTLCNFFSAILAIHTIDLSFLFAAYNLYACFREVPLPDMVCNGCFFVSELDTCITMIDYVFLFFP